jgi:hypothetical protein
LTLPPEGVVEAVFSSPPDESPESLSDDEPDSELAALGALGARSLAPDGGAAFLAGAAWAAGLCFAAGFPANAAAGASHTSARRIRPAALTSAP